MSPADLAAVNSEVNALPYKGDAERYGTPEFWIEIGKDGGDCEDYAIGKLNRLVALGWPVKDLRLACCYVETGEYHAVLIASADEGDMVLDNRKPHPFPVSELSVFGYKPDKIQGPGRTWVKWTGEKS